MFGVYDLCEQIGVSPWYFWADVPAKRKAFFALAPDHHKTDWPDVQYRGIFLNDEEELEAWSKLHTKDDTIGPKTYEKVFELILRLKGNYIWPAMHVNYFNGDPENARLADEMASLWGRPTVTCCCGATRMSGSRGLSKRGIEISSTIIRSRDTTGM